MSQSYPCSSICSTLKFDQIPQIYPPFSTSYLNSVVANTLRLPTKRKNYRFSKINCCSEKQSRTLRTCKNCKTQFDPTLNHPLACRFHIAHFGVHSMLVLMSAAAGGLKKLVGAALVQGVTETQAQIFGHILNPTAQRSAHEILRKKLIDDKVVEWYPYDINHDDPAVIVLQKQERTNKLEMLKHRGKGPPKKGHGKRASKRK